MERHDVPFATEASVWADGCRKRDRVDDDLAPFVDSEAHPPLQNSDVHHGALGPVEEAILLGENDALNHSIRVERPDLSCPRKEADGLGKPCQAAIVHDAVHDAD